MQADSPTHTIFKNYKIFIDYSTMILLIISN